MSDGVDPPFELEPSFEMESPRNAGAPGGEGDDSDSGKFAEGPWFLRFAGRRSGPFDAERLRTLARRGALTRVHSLSVDGITWVPAPKIRAVFNADGTVVASGAQAVAIEVDRDPSLGDVGGGSVVDLPNAPLRRAAGSALVRPVVLAALALASVVVTLPTSRDDTGALSWWWNEGSLGIAVRGLCCLAVVGGWSTAFLAPEPARAASVAAVAAVLSSAASLVAVGAAPWTAPVALLVPVSALLVALDAAGSGSVRAAGAVASVLSVLCALGTVVIGCFFLSAWTVTGMTLGVVGAGALGYGGFRAARGGPGAQEAVFWGGVAGATGALGALFAAAFSGLLGDVPMQGALAAVGACLVLSFASISWAAVHEACDSSHLILRTTSRDDDHAD